MTHPRWLILGIDSATLDLLGPWAERGDLPALGRLVTSGASGRLRSVPNMITPAAWTSFATGCNPGKHGIFYFTERIQGSYGERFIKGAARALPPFWMLLSQQGVSCTVINVPMSYPADPLRGVMVSGMDAPSATAPGFTHPPELAAELRQRFSFLLGPAGLSGAIGHLMLAGKVDAALEVLARRVDARTELARYLIERHPSELFLLVHTEVDGAQHYFWKFMDPRHPGYNPREAQRYGDSILRLYQKVDASLETLLQAFGPAQVLVMSDHGAGASPGVEDGVPWIRLVLEELGLAAPAPPQGGARGALLGGAGSLYRALNPRLPRSLRRLARRVAPGAVGAVKASVKHRYDWARTKAFCSGAAGDVWLNVRGREPQGTVEPGVEYERVREQIREAFLSLRDVRTGEPVVEAVTYREEAYSGPYAERAPDLIVRFSDVVIGDLALDGRVLHLERRGAVVPKEVKSGSHRPDGVLIMTGEGIRVNTSIAGAALADVAPTLLYWMGRDVPAYMDGVVLRDAFTVDHLHAHPVRSVAVEAPIAAPVGETGYTEEEAALVEERLRRLGYV